MSSVDELNPGRVTDNKARLFSLTNGLQVVCLPLDYVDYISMDLLLPTGGINDPSGSQGSSLVLGELISRGAGKFSSEQLLSAFDEHGIRHSESGSLLSFSLRSSFLPDKLDEAVELMTAMLSEPHLPAEELEPVTSLFLHDLRSIRENPSRWAMMELSSRCFPAPYNRSPLGEEDELLSLSRDGLAEQWSKRFGPAGGVLSVAGKFEEEELKAVLEGSLSRWEGEGECLPELSTSPERKKYFISFEGSQQQLVLRAPSVVMGDPHYYTAKVFSQILSGGMFGRLFIEVREKRGLCYSVYGQHTARPEYGSFTVYAGTTPERVHETYQVIRDIMSDPLAGLENQEIERAKNNLLSQIIIGEESTSSRSRSNASDWLLLGRIRPLEEIQREVQNVDAEALRAFVKEYPFDSPACMTLGAKNFENWELTTPTIGGVAALEGGVKGA